jgi:ABC-2 type transport system permease protein
VVEREFRTRVRSRFFQVSTAVSMIVIVAVIVVPSLARSPLRSVVKIGAVDRAPAEIESILDRTRFLLGSRVVVTAFPDRASADAALRAKRIHLEVVGTNEIVTLRPLPATDTSARGRVARLLSIAPAITGVPTAINSLGPPEPRRPGVITAFVGAVLTFTFVQTYGSLVLTGVAEEKGSRVIEILLASVRPSRLFAGKVIGIGGVALVQGLIIGGTALAAARAIGSDVLTSQPLLTVLSMLGWLLVGYAFYAAAYGAAGSMVSRQEEASGMSFPIGLPLIIAYVAASSAIGGEDSRFLRILSFLPPTAPIAMPMRSAIGAASPGQVAVAVILMLLGVIGMLRLGSVIYSRSILRMGRRVRFRELLGRD